MTTETDLLSAAHTYRQAHDDVSDDDCRVDAPTSAA